MPDTDPVVEAATKLKQLLDQNALINEGLKRIAKGKINGPDGLAAVIVALQGGAALDFQPIADFQ